MTRVLGGGRGPYGLTAREREVVELLIEGRSKPEVARVLFLAPSTVKSHQASIQQKMGCRNQVQIAVRWVREQEKSRAVVS